MRRAFVLAMFLSSILPFAPSRALVSVVEFPVLFHVRNVNRSLVPCLTDGQPYTVRGSLVAPDETFTSPDPAVTLYVHPGTGGEYFWHLRDVPAYDHITEMAKLGHASIAFDLPGYDSSGHPFGFLACVGGYADIIHQIVVALRSGDYAMGDGPGLAFSRLALAGLSSGGLMAEAASAFGDVDALFLSGWADALITSGGFLAGEAIDPTNGYFDCGSGGEPVEDDGSGATGYAYTWAHGDFGSPQAKQVHDVFHDVDPAVVEATLRLINRDPCGLLYSVGQAIAVNNVFAQTYQFPVLVVCGDHDLVTVQDCELHAQRFVLSGDVQYSTIPETGHVGHVERNAPVYRATMSDWLTARGF